MTVVTMDTMIKLNKFLQALVRLELKQQETITVANDLNTVRYSRFYRVPKLDGSTPDDVFDVTFDITADEFEADNSVVTNLRDTAVSKLKAIVAEHRKESK